RFSRDWSSDVCSSDLNEAIAENMAMMSTVRTPLIATVTGEANSGGAIAIGIADHLNMLEYSTYTVITPEGCATILWKSAEFASEIGRASSRERTTYTA